MTIQTLCSLDTQCVFLDPRYQEFMTNLHTSYIECVFNKSFKISFNLKENWVSELGIILWCFLPVIYLRVWVVIWCAYYTRMLIKIGIKQVTIFHVQMEITSCPANSLWNLAG